MSEEPPLVLGARRAFAGDIHHRFLAAPWWVALGAIVATFLALNAVFAAAYAAVGGLAGPVHGWLDYFSFSVHTMSTIGYGDVYPVSTGAQLLVICEAVVGLLVTAISTGLVFSKFTRSAGRVVFTKHATISKMDGVPTLAFRVGNERGNQIVEAQLRVTLVRTETTAEGVRFYRMYDLPLVRERSPAFLRSWTAMHRIEPGACSTARAQRILAREEAQIAVSLVGIDGTSLQPVHARHEYEHTDLVFGARLADILSERADGRLVVDLRKFHDVERDVEGDVEPAPEPEAGVRGPSPEGS